jgi:hypothetical protein
MSKFQTKTSITINGTSYDSIASVPERFKKFLHDADGNGTPDFIEDAIAQSKEELESELQKNPSATLKKSVVTVLSKKFVNGKEVQDDLEDFDNEGFTSTPAPEINAISQLPTSLKQNKEEKTPIILHLIFLAAFLVLVGVFVFSQ